MESVDRTAYASGSGEILRWFRWYLDEVRNLVTLV